MKTTNRKYARKRVHTEIITVTPTIAEEILATMPEGGNRHLRESHAQMLAGAITSGNWQLTHAGIAFDQAGRLIDGQHRMRAVVLAGLPVKIMATYGLPFETMDAVDRGASRTIHDLMHLVHQVEGGANLTAICAIIKREFHGEHAPLAVHEALAIHRRYQPGIVWICNALKARTVMNKAPIRAALALARLIEPRPGVAALFLDSYRTGEGLRRTDPVYRLREFVIKGNAEKEKASNADLFRITCNAFLSYAAGEEVRGVSRERQGIAFFRKQLKVEEGGAS